MLDAIDAECVEDRLEYAAEQCLDVVATARGDLGRMIEKISP
ncbi:MAG: hypothetical protein V9E93_00530 [Steroidobacteraceae bacterium]